jgi:polyketide synthase PksJ
VLHPSVLDGALQAVYAPWIHAARADAAGRTPEGETPEGETSEGIASAGRTPGRKAFEGKAPLPFALDSLEVQGATPATAYAWVREATGSSDDVRRWDIDLCDEHGRVFAALRGYCARRRPEAAPRTTERVTLLRPTWSERAAAPGPAPRYTARIALACGFEERLAELRALAPHITFLDPAEPAPGTAPDASADPRTRPEQAVSARAVQLFQALKGILLGRPAGPVLVQVLVLADGTGRLHEALSALLRTAHLENPALLGQLLSVPADATAAALAATLDDDSRSPRDRRVRHEGGRRHVLGWEPLTARRTAPERSRGGSAACTSSPAAPVAWASCSPRRSPAGPPARCCA